MTARTGLPQVHTAILEAVGTEPRYTKCARILERLPEDLDHGSLSAYEELGVLANPWSSVLPLVDPNGNFGSAGRDDPPADARYTECRLTPAGLAALAAERGDGPPIPFGLVLGDWASGGRRPPFDPGRVASALHQAADGDLAGAVEQLGPPVFPGGMTVRATRLGEDPRALEYGWLVHARVDAKFEPYEERGARGRSAVIVVAVPPGRGPWRISSEIAELANAIRRTTDQKLIAEINDETSTRTGTRIVIIAPAGVGQVEFEALLRAIPSLYLDLDLQLPRPARDILERWVSGHGAAAARAGAQALADLV